MKSEEEIRDEIENVKEMYHHVLFEGSLSDIQINAPRALLQLEGETALKSLYWVLGEKYIHKYPVRGINR